MGTLLKILFVVAWCACALAGPFTELNEKIKWVSVHLLVDQLSPPSACPRLAMCAREHTPFKTQRHPTVVVDLRPM
jgi:hypothetical protein